MDEVYDVVIVGAGPAGGQCARELAEKRKVLLIDRAKDFLENNYSSGGAPLEIMQEFSLPNSLVGTFWNFFSIASTHEKVVWRSLHPFGPVLDFDKLRTFLAEQVIALGSDVSLNCHYKSHQEHVDHVSIDLKGPQGERRIKAKVLVDATGSERKVLLKQPYDKNRALVATGIEYHIQVSPEIYEQYANSLNFFLGHKWMPQGYAWIFSMAPCQLKVGVIRYFQNKQYVPYTPSHHSYLNQMLSLCGKHYEILDKHGKTICYSFGQKDKRYQGCVLAIGDAISAINPLGCEGIRHALVSARMAASEIEKFLEGHVKDFKNYDRSMNRYFGQRWFLSELFMKSLYKTSRDELIDRMVRYFGLMDNEAIMDVIFRYRFSQTWRSYFWYFYSRMKDWFQQKAWV